jgi:hypothetical protein
VIEHVNDRHPVFGNPGADSHALAVRFTPSMMIWRTSSLYARVCQLHLDFVGNDVALGSTVDLANSYDAGC